MSASIRVRVLASALALLAICVAPSTSHAQDADDGGVDLLNFSPTAGPWGVFSTERSLVLEHLSFAVRAIGDYANEPLKTVNPDGADVPVVDGTATMHMTAAMGLFDIVEIGVVVPFVLLNEGNFNGRALGDNAVGDLRFRAKALGLNPDDFYGFGLGGGFEITAPTGERDEFNGADGVTGRIFAVADYAIGPVVIATNLGARFREETSLRNLTRTHEFDYRAGVSWLAVENLLEVNGEVFGTFPLGSEISEDFQSPAEWLLGTRFLTPSDIHFTVAGGTGLNEGLGAPRFRVIAGLEYAPLDPDTDGDGVRNSVDLCPDIPEDPDGWQDTDGCPDDDNDGDQIPDADDLCPDDPEDVDGFDDTDGCPEDDNDLDGIPDAEDVCDNEPEDFDDFEDEDGCPDDDNDGDGVSDLNDACPLDAEDADGFEDTDGCPEPDNDADGLCDAWVGQQARYGEFPACTGLDLCPDVPEDKDGFQDTDGCPDIDNDADGVLDVDDQCPDEKEVINGVDDTDGCPDEGASLVILLDTKIEIKERVFFETDKAAIKSDSFGLLDQVAQVMRANPALTRIRVEGHTDDVGDDDYNMKLSQERAESVVDYLVDKGVERSRLEPVGYGESQPLQEGKSKRARSANRRVEFVIVERKE